MLFRSRISAGWDISLSPAGSCAEPRDACCSLRGVLWPSRDCNRGLEEACSPRQDARKSAMACRGCPVGGMRHLGRGGGPGARHGAALRSVGTVGQFQAGVNRPGRDLTGSPLALQPTVPAPNAALHPSAISNRLNSFMFALAATWLRPV